MSEWQNPAEEEEEPAEFVGLGVPAIIFLVDARVAMAAGNPSPLQESLRTIASFCCDSVVTDNKQKIGVCLFGTEKLNNPNDFPNMHVLHDAEVPDAKQNKQLLDLAEGDGFDLFGHSSGKVAFHHALWVCSTMFSSCSGKLADKEIYVLTSDQDPTSGDLGLKKNAMRKAEDLRSLAVNLQVFPIVSEGCSFDTSVFYQPLLEAAGMYDTAQTSRLDELSHQIKIKCSKQRPACNLMLRLGPQIDIGVEMYVSARKAVTGSVKYVKKGSNQEIIAETSYISGESARKLEPSEIAQAYPFVDGFAQFSEDELRRIKSSGDDGVVVLGFCNRDTLTDIQNIKPSHFIYPSDKQMKGSEVAFAALHNEMLERKLNAVVSIRTTNKAAQLRMGVLLPQAADDELGQPAGFHAIYMPYADDIRCPTVFEHIMRDAIPTDPKEEEVSAATALLNTFNTDVSTIVCWENPALQKHYAVLEAMALRLDHPRSTGLLEPDYAALDSKALDHFNQTVYVPHGYDPDVAAKKPAAKKRKATEEPMVERDWAGLVADGRIKKLKVDDLKQYCAAHNLPKGGKKDDLITRISEHISSQ